MSNKQKTDETQNEMLESRLSTAISNNKKIIIGICVAIIVVLAILSVVHVVSENNTKKAVNTLATAQTELSTAYAADSTADDYQANIDAAIAKIEALETEKGYVGLKSTYLVALNNYNNKNYEDALSSFLDLAEKAKGTYLGSLALNNAIVCEEQLGNDAKTIEYCQQLLDEYGNEAAESPKAMFTLARVYEKQGNTELAKSQFQQLSDQFPNSEYGKLAKNSLLNY